jgi:hypothetical protein
MRLIHRRHQFVVVTILVAACPFSCVTGRNHERATFEPAELVTTSSQSESGYSTRIVAIDGNAKRGSSFTLRPGRHTVEVLGTSVERDRNQGAIAGAALVSPIGALGMHLESAISASRDALHSDRLMACFIARPNRIYEVRTFGEGGVWKVEVVDQTTTYDVKSPCKTAARTKEPARPDQPLTDPFD